MINYESAVTMVNCFVKSNGMCHFYLNFIEEEYRKGNICII